jgi:hypothetical protein
LEPERFSEIAKKSSPLPGRMTAPRLDGSVVVTTAQQRRYIDRQLRKLICPGVCRSGGSSNTTVAQVASTAKATS